MAEKDSNKPKKYKAYEMVTLIKRLEAFNAARKPQDYGTGEADGEYLPEDNGL